MFAVTRTRPPRTGGFTLIEAAVVVAIMGILLAAGMPSMSGWLLGRKAIGAATFYQDAFLLARNTAIAHNSHSRLVLTTNAISGKQDWQVDICFANGTTCDSTTGGWSTVSAAADKDPDTSKLFRSIARSADSLPPASVMTLTIAAPVTATSVYFTPLGWVDTSVTTPLLTGLDLAPPASRPNAFAKIGVRLTLGGQAVICNPAAASTDARRCPS